MARTKKMENTRAIANVRDGEEPSVGPSLISTPECSDSRTCNPEHRSSNFAAPRCRQGQEEGTPASRWPSGAAPTAGSMSSTKDARARKEGLGHSERWKEDEGDLCV